MIIVIVILIILTNIIILTNDVNNTSSPILRPLSGPGSRSSAGQYLCEELTPNLPTNIIPANIA